MKNYILLFLIIPLFSYSQVGIFTSNPEEELHIAGTNSQNVIIEGLSKTMNDKNLGPESTTKVFVNNEGDLVLGDRDDNINFIYDYDDYIVTETFVINQTGTGSNFTKITLPTSNPNDWETFTMLQDGFIEVNYSLSWYIGKNEQNDIMDSGARVVESSIYIYDHTESDYILNESAEDAEFAITGQFYSNGHRTIGAAGKGNASFYNTGSDYIPLAAGTYSVILGVRLTEIGNNNVKLYPGRANDQLQVIAYY